MPTDHGRKHNTYILEKLLHCGEDAAERFEDEEDTGAGGGGGGEGRREEGGEVGLREPDVRNCCLTFSFPWKNGVMCVHKKKTTRNA